MSCVLKDICFRFYIFFSPLLWSCLPSQNLFFSIDQLSDSPYVINLINILFSSRPEGVGLNSVYLVMLSSEYLL